MYPHFSGATPAPSEASAGKGDSNGKMGNTIGQLQELCVREGYPMPTYDLSSVDGQPHQRNFKITVSVGDMTNNGEGTSKKDAKRDAAAKMIEDIRGRLLCTPLFLLLPSAATLCPMIT